MSFVASLVILPVMGILDSIPEPVPFELMVPLFVMLPRGKLEPNKASAVPETAVIEPPLVIAPVMLPKELMALIVATFAVVEMVPKLFRSTIDEALFKVKALPLVEVIKAPALLAIFPAIGIFDTIAEPAPFEEIVPLFNKLPPKEPAAKLIAFPAVELMIPDTAFVKFPVIAIFESMPEPVLPEEIVPLLVKLGSETVEAKSAKAVPELAVIEPLLLMAPVILPKEWIALTVGLTEVVEMMP